MPYCHSSTVASTSLLKLILIPGALTIKVSRIQVSEVVGSNLLIISGFEGLTIAADESTLFALLQSATMQDGGTSDQTNRYTRLLSYDITSSPAKLVGEWVVPLPQTSKGKTIAANEVHFISPTIFLILTRDSLGHGGDDGDPTSKHKNIDLIDISNATNISGMQFDNASSPIAPDGLLDPAIIPAEYFAFVDLLDATQLSRFGLHNGDPVDETLIDAKWESIAIAPAGDKANPDDYFLFTFVCVYHFP